MIAALCMLLSAAMAATPAPTPSEALTAKMILIEVAQSESMGLSESRSDHHQCRRFQADSFADASAAFMLASHPESVLYLPQEHADSDISGRPVGVCWDMPNASTGNAFVEVARFDYDSALSAKENLEAAKAFLAQVKAGDVLQMLGSYTSGGRGTHTIMFTRPFDPRLDSLYWSDSNFANRRIDGKRHGIVKPYQQWPLLEFAGWLTKDLGNGATLYRLSDNIVWRAGQPVPES